MPPKPKSVSREVSVRQSWTPVQLSPNSRQAVGTHTQRVVHNVNGKRVTDSVTVQVRRTVTSSKKK